MYDSERGIGMQDMEILLQGDGWVVMMFEDGTAQSVHTSLNPAVLAEFGIEPTVNKFFDLDRLRFVSFREDAKSVIVTKEKPEFDLEVLRFASRFI